MFQCELAFYHEQVGYGLTATEKPVEALHAYEKACDIHQKLVDAHPAELIDDYRDAAAMLRHQDAIEQGRLTRAEKPGQDDDGGFGGGSR